MGKYDSDIAKHRKEIASLKAEQAPYQRDFAILHDEEIKICQVIELFSELSDENDELSIGFRHMAELHTDNVSFPDMDILTDFSVPNGNANQLISFFDSYSHDLKRVCKEIDEKKKEIGGILGTYHDKISDLEDEIRHLDAIGSAAQS